MKVTVNRTAMLGVQGGMSYDVRVPVEYVPNYDGARYITIISGENRFVDFSDATRPESHFWMDRGPARLRSYLEHKEHARRQAFNIAAAVFPELEKLRTATHGKLPELWAFNLLENETSATITTDVHEYSCGCFYVTQEAGRYYDHACATCHREGWTKGKTL